MTYVDFSQITKSTMHMASSLTIFLWENSEKEDTNGIGYTSRKDNRSYILSLHKYQ